MGGLKLQLGLTVEFFKDGGDIKKVETSVLCGDQMAILTPDKIDEFYNN